MLKWIARKILRSEIETYQKTISDLQSDNSRMIDEKSDQTQRNLQQSIEQNNEKLKLMKENEELEKENEILRKYYDLDKEPSDEIKMKIHIDLELNRVKEENLKLIAMANRKPQYMPIPIPYPQYSPFGRF